MCEIPTSFTMHACGHHQLLSPCTALANLFRLLSEFVDTVRARQPQLYGQRQIIAERLSNDP